MKRQKIIAERLKLLNSRIPRNVRLVAVSKHTGVDDIEYARQNNQWDFGENRVDEINSKAQYFQNQGHSNLRWHFIGKIQTKKINRLLKTPGLAFLHSVDSLKLLKELYKKEENLPSSRLHFFLQINTSQETQKQGFTKQNDIYQAVNLCLKNDQSKLQLVGFMTMASLKNDPRPCFRNLAALRNDIANDFNLKNLKLSMGMGDDFPVALEEGADFVRIGRIIFNN